MTALLPHQLLLTLLVPVVLISVGTLAFHFLEGYSVEDSVYLTVMTLTTVGYGDVVPRTTAGRIFTMSLALCGVFTIFYAATAAIRVVVSGEIAVLRGRRYMEHALSVLKDHIIVCGYGRMGRLVCKEFTDEAVPYVVVDADEALMREFRLPHGIAYVGNATADDTLRAVGIERARGLVAVMASDAENLFTTMSARLLNSRLFIVARVEDLKSEPKFLRAGANRVVSPYLIGGARVAQAVLRPTVVDFIELATRKEHIDLQMEEARIYPQSPLVGKALKATGLRTEMNVIIVAIKKPSGHMHFNPAPETLLEAGDILVAIGHRQHLKKLDLLAHPVP